MRRRIRAKRIVQLVQWLTVLSIVVGTASVGGQPGAPATGEPLQEALAGAAAASSLKVTPDILAGIFATLEALPGPPEGPVPTPGYDPTSVFRQFSNGRLPESGLYSLSKDCQLLEEMARRLRALFRAAAAAGYPMFAMSCYRTYEHQTKLYNDAVAVGRGVFVASPGRSNHGWGLAADIWPTRLASVLNKSNWYDYWSFDSPEWKFLDANAARFGLIFFLRPGVVPEEPWHIEAVEVRR